MPNEIEVNSKLVFYALIIVALLLLLCKKAHECYVVSTERCCGNCENYCGCAFGSESPACCSERFNSSYIPSIQAQYSQLTNDYYNTNWANERGDKRIDPWEVPKGANGATYEMNYLAKKRGPQLTSQLF